MTDNRININEEELDKVVGGLFEWYRKSGKMVYTHKDGTVSTHKVNDYENGHAMSCNLHGQNVPEDEILAQLINAGYID